MKVYLVVEYSWDCFEIYEVFYSEDAAKKFQMAMDMEMYTTIEEREVRR